MKMKIEKEKQEIKDMATDIILSAIQDGIKETFKNKMDGVDTEEINKIRKEIKNQVNQILQMEMFNGGWEVNI